MRIKESSWRRKLQEDNRQQTPGRWEGGGEGPTKWWAEEDQEADLPGAFFTAGRWVLEAVKRA